MPAYPMRIAHVTSIHADFDKRIWRYCQSLVQNGVTSHLICPWNIPNNSVHEGVHFHTFKRVSKRLLRPLLIPIRIFPLLFRARRQVDLFHFHDLDLLPLMAFVSLFHPVIYDVHENYPDEMLDREYIPAPLRRPLYWIVKGSEFIFSKTIGNLIVVCSDQENRFRNIPARLTKIMNYASISIAQNAITSDYHLRQDKIVFTGGHYKSNGSLLLLEIASLLKPLRPRAKFMVIDWFPIPEFKKLFLDYARKLDVLDILEFHSPVAAHEIMSILNQGTIAISPNLRNPKQEKAVPTKLFEYMAAGLPVVSSDLSFASALFSEEGFGILAQPENPTSFVKALMLLIDQRELSNLMGIKAQQEFLEKYTWDSQIPRLIEFYQAVIGEN